MSEADGIGDIGAIAIFAGFGVVCLAILGIPVTGVLALVGVLGEHSPQHLCDDVFGLIAFGGAVGMVLGVLLIIAGESMTKAEGKASRAAHQERDR